MFKFPEGLYTDVRIEDVFQTSIQITMGKLDDVKEKSYKAAFIRLYDGKRWYYSSTSDVDSIQKEIEALASIACKNENIKEDPIFQRFEVHKSEFLKFTGKDSVKECALNEKMELLKNYSPIIASSEYVKLWRANYIDLHVKKSFHSSKGSNIVFDTQRVGMRISYELSDGDRKFADRFDRGSNYFSQLKGLEEEIKSRFGKSIHFLKEAAEIKPGKYTVVLSPEAAGVFAHESFGHKSESDFMIGDKSMEEEWKIGKKVGSEILSIVDDGSIMGTGYTPFDDEGTKAKETYLIKKGVLSGRLHSAKTAAALGEGLTGNARALNFEFEPIVRMTTTFIKGGDKTFEELISDIKEGIFVETLKHGSGMSTFTLAPSMAYMIRDGKIAEPVKISVVTGNVFETLNEIEGLTKDVKILEFALGGCGKFEQFPLPVGFGGPYVRVKSLNVR
ncbi:peptidase [Kosmotoga arenicorallina S304]|uniref:Peptidase n=1 Tax=Kosmotoga arenicorallina S304 TaxID=1453497 RepID=A0A176K037_9BACT|nr:TldD/PmbA family protein [Kosmotoga arenicorallina]OAA29917.1 peptidase [Kosmotoga arenicorallina S304]